jgi:hypothetical protein
VDEALLLPPAMFVGFGVITVYASSRTGRWVLGTAIARTMPVRAPREWEAAMTLCPVAMMVGCKKCPIVGICLVKSFIGDYKAEEEKAEKAKASKAEGGKKSA